MLSRKEQEKPGILFPEPWRKKVEDLLYSVYAEKCEAVGKAFQVHGITYPDELFLAVGLVELDHLENAAVTYIVSLDLKEGDKDYEKNIESLVDSMGVFFDTYFADLEWNDYVSNWTDATFQKLNFFYKVSRENIALTIKAEALLNQ